MEENNKEIGRTDLGWTDWVLTHFEEDEKIKGLPLVDGLRRVAEIIVGEIISSEPTSSHLARETHLSFDERGQEVQRKFSYAKASWRYTFKTKSGEIKTFGDAADVTIDNVENKDFARFGTALAATRAKARALREALGLKKIVAFEEMGSMAEVNEYADKQKIKDNQIAALEVFCERNDVNLWNYVNMGKMKYKNIKDISYESALKMMKQIDKFQRNKDTIPENIKGFDSDWRNNTK